MRTELGVQKHRYGGDLSSDQREWRFLRDPFTVKIRIGKC